MSIPYVISIAHPDYKRPYVQEIFGAVDEQSIESFFLQRVVDFILNDDMKYESTQDIKRFWTDYYNESYMDNRPWTARIYKDGAWKDATPTNEQIIRSVQERYKEEED